MNKQTQSSDLRPHPDAESVSLSKWKPKPILIGIGLIVVVLLIALVAGTFAQSSSITLGENESLQLICDGRGFQLERTSRTDITLTCRGSNNNPTPTSPPIEPTDPPPDPTREPSPDPTREPSPEPTAEPEPTSPPPPPPGEKIEPYAGAPACQEVGLTHDPRAWHGIWDYEYGCHWDHEHKRDPHDMDDIFGTKIYEWAGGELSYPWETFAGAYDSLESYEPGTCTENECKHEGYHWLYFRDRTSQENINGALLLGQHVVTDARVQYHQIGGQLGALTRFHSVWVEARACRNGEVSNQTCGIFRGGGWLDLGRLNYPDRGIYYPLPGDPAVFGDAAISGPPEAEPYRIHAVGSGSLDSWQSEGNQYNYLPSDPTGDFRLRVGYGIHFPDSPGETDPTNYGNSSANQQFWCYDEATNLYTCEFNNSSAALFRLWVTIPSSLDGSKYDEDGQANGYFTFHGYTNRYGDIVEGCSAPGLDCVPTEAENFPVGGCGQPDGLCKAAYRGSLDQDLFEADLAPLINERTGERDWWIKYPN